MLRFRAIPHPGIGTTKDYCRYVLALLIPDVGAITAGGLGFPWISEIPQHPKKLNTAPLGS